MIGTVKQSKERSTGLKVVFIWLVILLLGSFWLTVRGTSDPVSMTVIPQVPREGEPIMVTFKLNNPSSDTLVTRYHFYANGELLKEGATAIAPGLGKTYKYAYENLVPLGERVNFMVRTESEEGHYEKLLSSPPFPPQVMSSFVSFASFSTSVMSSMSSMTYYNTAFGGSIGFNVGLFYTVILIALLIFMELSQPLLKGRTVAILGGLRLRLNIITWILFIVLVGMVYTRMVMIIAT